MPVERTTLTPPGHSKPVGSYSPGMAVHLGDNARLIFVTGQVATDNDGSVICPGDPAGQTRVVFERIAAVLSEAGGSLNDLVSLTIYLRHMHQFPQVSPIRDSILDHSRPSSTLVEVSALAEDGCLVEISAVAAL